ncbi:hypothetical protein LOK49_LG11G00017 [Camellia lanceoleosa]|uniref:Uncharacterized protein n=1 Tax=Camellia lanceoleosa TaxID=1840588 RepID=A0ACC0G4N4_9ERIC|nr:hypothetical protein LOK49_LG11G00017 [Camellia lanceoleosa]
MATTTSKLENEDPSRAPTGEEASGLNIQRLVSFGFAVGRFSRDRRTSEHNLLVAYAKMNGGFGNDGVSRRITVGSRRGRSTEGSGLGSAFHNLFFLGRFTSSCG